RQTQVSDRIPCQPHVNARLGGRVTPVGVRSQPRNWRTESVMPDSKIPVRCASQNIGRFPYGPPDHSFEISIVDCTRRYRLISLFKRTEHTRSERKILAEVAYRI